LIFQGCSIKYAFSPVRKIVNSGEVMKQRVLGFAAICVVSVLIPGCGSHQRLVAISVTPAAVVFGTANAALTAQLTATGIYEHPPATKDLTKQVTWSSSVAGVAVVNSTGVVSPAGSDCGVTGISATFKTDEPTGNIITGTMNVTVDGPAAPCPTTPIAP
jgi:hypothetical protein